MNEGIAPPVFSTVVGRARLLTGDTDARNIDAGRGEYLWSSDDELQALIDLKGSPERAAIHVLRMVAMTPAMQLKKWSSADLTVDGPAITRALRDLIKDLEAALDGGDEAAASTFAALVPTGAAISQPYFYPGATGVDIDPTLPMRIM